MKKTGAKPKFKQGIETVTIHVLIPTEKRKEVLTAIDEIVKNEKYETKNTN